MSKCAIVLFMLLATFATGCQRSTANSSTATTPSIEKVNRSAGAITLDDGSFDAEITNGHGVALVDFYARWCGPCKRMSPIIEAMAAEMPEVKIARLDVDAARATADKFNVHEYPYFIVFKDGKEVERHSGTTTREEMNSWIATYSGGATR